MASLDILSPKGQQSLRDERDMLESLRRVFESSGSSMQIVETDKDTPCSVDGFLIKNGIISGVFESKVRYMDRAKMRKYNNEWLVTFDKINTGLQLSKILCVPFYGLLYLVHEPIGMMVHIGDEFGDPVANMKVAQTTTSKTCNGGVITKANAFIDIGNAFEFEIFKEVP